MSLFINWTSVPVLALVEMFTMLDFESLHNCRRVCTVWNQVILRNVWGLRTNRKKMELKFRRFWDTGIRRTETTSRTLGFHPGFVAASGDTIILTESLVQDNAFLKILCKGPNEWSLPVDGRILQCVISRNLILLLIKGKNLAKRMEVYDTFTHHKVFSRRLGAGPRIFLDAPNILLRHFNSTSHIASEELELIDVQDSSLSFRYPLNEINCSKILCFNFPHLILFSRARKKIYVKIIDAESKNIRDVNSFYFDSDFHIRGCAFEEEHIFLLLSSDDRYTYHIVERSHLGQLLVINKDGKKIRQLKFQDFILSWNHTACGFFIITFKQHMNHYAKLYNTRDILRQDRCSYIHEYSLRKERESSLFSRPEELNKCHMVTFLSNHSIKTIQLEPNNVRVENTCIQYSSLNNHDRNLTEESLLVRNWIPGLVES